MTDVVILSAVRTPIGRFQGGLAPLRAPELGAIAIREAVKRAKVEVTQIDEVIMGLVLAAGVGQAPARQAALLAGIPPAVAALTINKVCGSGLKAVALAAQAIRAGDAEVVVAGGMESMSNAPYLLEKARTGLRLGHGEVIDSLIKDGLWDAPNDFHMGETAELVAEKYDVPREVQDQYAARSQVRAGAAIEAGKFKKEIVPVVIKDRKGNETRIDTDEGVRGDTTAEGLGKLRPAFRRENGTVTAGNASTINDGAAAVVVASAEAARRMGATPLCRITGYAVGGVEPKWVMMAPVEAVKKLNAKLGVKVDHYQLVEVNEAFASASVAVTRACGFDPEAVNVNGGAIALGHPIGASGARILTTLLYAMEDRKKTRGLATLCLGGGNAVALAVERLS
jgi:acetyl-CoA C-acetyltransferase